MNLFNKALLGLSLLWVSSVFAAPTDLFATAQAYYSGHGVARDLSVAADYFHSAALEGIADAQYLYGLMLYRGEGVSQDFAEAARYYTMAAQNGSAKAQYNLAVLYYEGRGVVRSDADAYLWLTSAAAHGEPRAVKMRPVAERNLSAELKAEAFGI